MRINKDIFEYLATQVTLTGEQSRVLFYLLSRLDFTEYRKISQGELAEALNLQKTNAHRSIRILESEQIIISGPKSGMNKTYRLNSDIIKKTNSTNQSKTPTVNL